MEEKPPSRGRSRWIVPLLCTLLVVGAWTWGLLNQKHLVIPSSSRGSFPSITVEPVTVFAPSYPRADLVPGLLDEPARLDRLRGWSHEVLEFTPWFEGHPVLLRGKERRYDALGDDLKSRARLRTPEFAFHIEIAPAGGEPAQALALLAAEDTDAISQSAAGIDANSRVLWSWKSPRRSIKACAVLYDESGPCGFALGPGGEAGLMAVDLHGGPLWQVKKEHVVYELRTHRALPGLLLFTDGWFTLFGDAGGRAPPRILLGGDADAGAHGRERLFASHGRLFPDASGRAAVALAGTTLHSDVPVLVRLDAEGHEQWRARLPSEPEGLAMIEPGDRPRLFAVTTEGGDLLVVDEDGCLRAEVRLPDAPVGKRTATYVLTAGRLGAAGWAIAVRLLKATYVYRVHMDRIPAR